MLTNSRDIVRRLQADGWVEVRIKGSHHVFKHPDFRYVISVMHPQKDLGKGLIRKIYTDAGWKPD